MIEVSQHLTALIITEGPMSCPRSYPEHRPTLTVAYSAATPSRWGFFPVILQYLRRLELPQRLQTVTVPSAPNAHFTPLDQLMTLVTLFLTGIARISHIDRTRAGESALARLLGLDRFPSSDTLYTLLGKVTAWHVKQRDRIHGGGCRRAGPVRQGHDDRRPRPVGQIRRGPQTAGGDPRLQPETPRAGLLPVGRGVRLRAGRLAAVVRRRHLGPGRGEDRPGGPAAADAPPEPAPARRRLPGGEGAEPADVPA